jgi:hypothetical protein
LESGVGRVPAHSPYQVGDAFETSRNRLDAAINADRAAAAARCSGIKVYAKVAGVPVGCSLPAGIQDLDFVAVKAWARAFAVERRLSVCIAGSPPLR